MTKESDVILLTACIFGEARNQGIAGMLAVGSVVLNRVKRGGWFGSTVEEVILKPKQFSCFNQDDPNKPLLTAMLANFENFETDAEVKECYWIAKGILDGYLRSNVGKATHYCRFDCHPAWEKVMTYVCRVGVHQFFQEMLA